MEPRAVNEAELLLFTRNTTKIIKKLIEMHQKGKFDTEKLKQKLKLLKENLKKKFEKLQQDDGLKPIDNLEYAIQEYFEQNNLDIYEKKIPFFEDLNIKEMSIQQNDMNKVKQFCDTNKSLLKELESDLVKKLTVQRFIILCLKDEHNNAIQFIKTNKVPADDIKEWLFLLIRDHNFYKEKISEHRNSLISEYRRVLCHIKGLPLQTRLVNRIAAGIIALNSIDCLNKNKKSDCPTCLPWIQKLAAKLPYSRRTNTYLRCKGCDEEINECNRPLVYETKYIYSEKYLKTCGYIVYCMKTKKYCKNKPEVCFFL